VLKPGRAPACPKHRFFFFLISRSQNNRPSPSIHAIIFNAVVLVALPPLPIGFWSFLSWQVYAHLACLPAGHPSSDFLPLVLMRRTPENSSLPPFFYSPSPSPSLFCSPSPHGPRRPSKVPFAQTDLMQVPSLSKPLPCSLHVICQWRRSATQDQRQVNLTLDWLGWKHSRAAAEMQASLREPRTEIIRRGMGAHLHPQVPILHTVMEELPDPGHAPIQPTRDRW